MVNTIDSAVGVVCLERKAVECLGSNEHILSFRAGFPVTLFRCSVAALGGGAALHPSPGPSPLEGHDRIVGVDCVDATFHE